VNTLAFVAVEVEPGEATSDGVSLRFKTAGAPRAVTRLRYEAEDGTAGWWRVSGGEGGAATAVQVEDSSDGTSCLIVGDAQGLVLVHEASGRRAREAYLLLAVGTAMET
jgi:hypothetical protein